LVQIELGSPPVVNDARATEIARAAAVEVVGQDRVEELAYTNMGGEDFAFYLEHVPGCYIRYGAAVEGREGYPAHSGRFDFHEDAIATGAAWLSQVARTAGDALR
jgi:hippurate hydrolase